MVRCSFLRLSGRIPSIKFRKGGLAQTHETVTPSATITQTSGQQGQHPVSSYVMEDYQLPLRYRRAPLSQEEIDYINGGGAI